MVKIFTIWYSPMLSFLVLGSQRTGSSVVFLMSLGTVPIEAFLKEAVPIFLFENCLPLQSVFQLLEGDYKSTGYT